VGKSSIGLDGDFAVLTPEKLQIPRSSSKTALWVDGAAWILFCGVCVQMVFLQWEMIIIPGVKANLFLGVVCVAALSTAIISSGSRYIHISCAEIGITCVLIVLAVLSASSSALPLSSSTRAFVFVSSASGGYWCARLLMSTPDRVRAFVWLTAAVLAGLLALSYLGFVFTGATTGFVGFIFRHQQQIVQCVILLLFAPLALISSGSLAGVAVGIVELAGCSVILYFIGSVGHSSAVLVIPLLAAAAVFSVRSPYITAAAMLFLSLASAGATYYVVYLSPEDFTKDISQEYRVESYPFSRHVVKKAPWLGIGMRAPREEYLSDYRVTSPVMSKEEFRQLVARLVTPENVFLALMVGLGIPFVTVYVIGLVGLLYKLLVGIPRPPPRNGPAPVVLLVPIFGSILHSLTTDTLFSPQLSWFFHILLGLIPRAPACVSSEQPARRSLGLRFAGMTAAVAIGIVIGSHQTFAPEGRTHRSVTTVLLKKVPMVSLLWSRWSHARTTTEPPGPTSTPTDRPPAASVPRKQKTSNGVLVVHLENFPPLRRRWAVAFVLDTSESMGAKDDSRAPNRFEQAVTALTDIASALPTGSRFTVRAVTDEIRLRAFQKDIPVRLSQTVSAWRNGPYPDLAEKLSALRLHGEANACNAATTSVRTDFWDIDDLSPRLVIITDGGRRCAARRILAAVRLRNFAVPISVDVVVIGAGAKHVAEYAATARRTGGLFLEASRPEPSPSGDGQGEGVHVTCRNAKLRRKRMKPPRHKGTKKNILFTLYSWCLSVFVVSISSSSTTLRRTPIERGNTKAHSNK
jgi:uncharacterized protein YhfF